LDLIDDDVVEYEKTKDKTLNDTDAIEKARNRIIRLATVKTCKYPEVYVEIKKKFIYKNDVYPDDGVKGIEQIQHYITALSNKKKAKQNAKKTGDANAKIKTETLVGEQHHQTDNLVPDVEDRVFKGIICYLCQDKGHYIISCLLKKVLDDAKQKRIKVSAEQQYYKGVSVKDVKQKMDEDVNNGDNESSDKDSLCVEWAFSYYNNDVTSNYSNEDILIDTGSTVSVFKNESLLMNTKNAIGKLRAFSNGGWQDSTRVGMVPKFFSVWFNPDSRLNILSFADVRKKYQITMDTAVEAAFFVHLNNKEVWKFEESSEGLYLLTDKIIKSKL